MPPQSYRFYSCSLALLLVASLAATPASQAQQDAPPIDVGQLLQTLRALREQQTSQLRTQKQTAIQQLSSVAASPEKAVQLWEDAVRATQFDGMAKEGAQFRAWKEGEGEALKERLVQNAVQLHLRWLILTLQHSSEIKTKELLPSVVTYTKDLVADEAAIEALEESMKREKEAAAIAPAGGARRNQNQPNKVSDAIIKRTHDQILKPSLAGSPVVKWMKLTDAVRAEGGGRDDGGRGGRRADGAAGGTWESSPAGLDGIFQKIILPELRDQKDMRVLEYWDLKLKKEADAASRSRLAYEIEKFNNERRPTLLWSRSQEFIALGQKNRAISEMFGVIKAHPTHPQADDWIAALEQLLVPPAPAPTAAPSDSAATIAPPPPKVPGL